HGRDARKSQVDGAVAIHICRSPASHAVADAKRFANPERPVAVAAVENDAADRGVVDHDIGPAVAVEITGLESGVLWPFDFGGMGESTAGVEHDPVRRC